MGNQDIGILFNELPFFSSLSSIQHEIPIIEFRCPRRAVEFQTIDQGIEKRDEHKDRKVDWWIAMRPSKRRQLADGSLLAETELIKAQIRVKVEHPFRCIRL